MGSYFPQLYHGKEVDSISNISILWGTLLNVTSCLLDIDSVKFNLLILFIILANALRLNLSCLMSQIFQKSPLDWLRERFQGVCFCVSFYLFKIRCLLYFSGIVIKINILTSYCNIYDDCDTPGEGLGEPPTDNFYYHFWNKY